MTNLNKRMTAVVFLSLSMLQTALPANPGADAELEELRGEAARHCGMAMQDLCTRIDAVSAQVSPEQKEGSVDYSSEECKYLSKKLGYCERVLSGKEIYEKAQRRLASMIGLGLDSAEKLEDFKKQFRLEG